MSIRLAPELLQVFSCDFVCVVIQMPVCPINVSCMSMLVSALRGYDGATALHDLFRSFTSPDFYRVLLNHGCKIDCYETG